MEELKITDGLSPYEEDRLLISNSIDTEEPIEIKPIEEPKPKKVRKPRKKTTKRAPKKPKKPKPINPIKLPPMLQEDYEERLKYIKKRLYYCKDDCKKDMYNSYLNKLDKRPKLQI